MLLADIDLNAEFFRLFKLLVAIAQPLLLVILCCCFVLACVHLLTMLGTRWGNRRVSSKAMLFSLAVHLSLAIGIVSLIPEYRQRIWARLMDSDETATIQVVSTVKFDDSRGAGANGEGLSILKQMPRPVGVAFTRTDQLEDPFTDLKPQVDKPETVASLPDSPQSSPEPPTVQATPERVAAANQILQEFAAATLAAPERPAESRAESTISSPGFQRTTAPSEAPRTEELRLPNTGAVERIADAPIPSADPESVRLDVDQQATIQRGDDDEIVSRKNDVPLPATADPTTGSEPGRNAAPSQPSPPSIARSGPLRTESPAEAGSAEIERPSQPAPGETVFDPRIEGPTTPSMEENPTLARADVASSAGSTAPYQMRAPDMQKRAVEEFGGSIESEAAVELSLKFLANAQEESGRWNVARWEGGLLTRSPDGERRDFVASDLDVGVTALATLAFLGKNNTLDKGAYHENVQRSVRWLISQQHANGFIGLVPKGRNGTVPGNMSGMYGHGMATFALAEAYAMSRDWPEATHLRKPVEKAVAFILASQLEDGSWRYFQYQTQGGDMSLFGWQLMALKSAQGAGIPTPSKVRQKMVDFLKTSARGKNGGLAGYRQSAQVSASMTAEALFCRQMLGVGRETPSSVEAATFLLSPRNAPARQRIDLYYWYYGSLAMMQFGGAEWDQWNIRVRDLLISEQEHDGENAGSWPPRDPWSGYGGRIYATAMATMCLEVYYRYMPIYEMTPDPTAPAEPGQR